MGPPLIPPYAGQKFSTQSTSESPVETREPRSLGMPPPAKRLRTAAGEVAGTWGGPSSRHIQHPGGSGPTLPGRSGSPAIFRDENDLVLDPNAENDIAALGGKGWRTTLKQWRAEMKSEQSLGFPFDVLERLVKRGDQDGLLQAIDAGANLNVRSPSGDSLLDVAARCESPDMIRVLMPVDLDSALAESNLFSASFCAMKAGRSQNIKALRKAGWSITPLVTHVIQHGSEQDIRILSAAGVNFASINQEGYGIIHHIVSYGQVSILRVFLGDGFDANHCSKKGVSPLEIAVKKGRLDMIWELVTRADVNVNLPFKSGFTPLQTAIVNGRVEAVTQLVALGAFSATVLAQARSLNNQTMIEAINLGLSLRPSHQS